MTELQKKSLLKIYEDAKSNIFSAVSMYGNNIECNFSNVILRLHECVVSINVTTTTETISSKVYNKIHIDDYIENDNEVEEYVSLYRDKLSTDLDFQKIYFPKINKAFLELQQEKLNFDKTTHTYSKKVSETYPKIIGYYETCQICGGTGEEKCPQCSGSKKLICSECMGKKVISNKICDKCNGKGYVTCSKCDSKGNVKCESCNGSGFFTQQYLVKFNTTITAKLQSFEDPFLNSIVDNFTDLEKIFLDDVVSIDFLGDGNYNIIKYIPEIKFNVSVKAKNNYYNYEPQLIGTDVSYLKDFRFSTEIFSFSTINNYIDNLQDAENIIKNNSELLNIVKAVTSEKNVVEKFYEHINAKTLDEDGKTLNAVIQEINKSMQLKECVKFFSSTEEFCLFCLPILKMARDYSEKEKKYTKFNLWWIIPILLLPLFNTKIAVYCILLSLVFQIFNLLRVKYISNKLYGSYIAETALESTSIITVLSTIMGIIYLIYIYFFLQ